MPTQSLSSPSHHAAPAHQPPAALRATGVVGVLAVVIAIVAIAFALPAARSKPHDVPIGAAGPQAASGQVADILEHNAPGAFDITYYPGEAALRDAIRNRDVYGGISFAPDGRTLLIATGASPTVAQLLSQVGTGIAQHAGVALRTEDVAPPTADDPRGAGLAASGLPITLAGLLPAVALVLVHVLGLQGMQARVLLLCAALPTATNAYVLAVRMGGDGRTAAVQVTLGTLASMATLPMWMAV